MLQPMCLSRGRVTLWTSGWRISRPLRETNLRPDSTWTHGERASSTQSSRRSASIYLVGREPRVRTAARPTAKGIYPTGTPGIFYIGTLEEIREKKTKKKLLIKCSSWLRAETILQNNVPLCDHCADLETDIRTPIARPSSLSTASTSADHLELLMNLHYIRLTPLNSTCSPNGLPKNYGYQHPGTHLYPKDEC